MNKTINENQSMTEPTITKPQLLQFMHNDGSGFVAGYGQEETDAYIAAMEAQHSAEISQLKAEFQRIIDKASRSIVDASKTLTTIAQDGLLDAYETIHSVKPKSESVGNADTNNVSDTSNDKDTRRKDFAELKQSIRSMVAKYVSKNGRMSEAECASLSGMSCLDYDYDMR